MGRTPGFNPNHIAAGGFANKIGFLGVATNGNFVNLLTGAKGTLTGTVTPMVDGAIGRSINTGVASTAQITFSVGPATTPTVNTLAAILRTYTGFGGTMFPMAIGTGGSGSGLLIDGSGNILYNEWSGSNSGASVQLAVSTPYFVVASNYATTCNILSLNLATGQILTSTSGGQSPGAQNGTVAIGQSNSAAFGLSLPGALAAAMWAQVFFGMQQLRAWAADVWSLWYPPTEFETLNWMRGPAVAAAVNEEVHWTIYRPRVSRWGH